MNKKYLAKGAALLMFIFMIGCDLNAKSEEGGTKDSATVAAPAETSSEATANSNSCNKQSKRDLKHQALLNAYPNQITDIKDNQVVFADGKTIVFDDGKEKSFKVMLDDSDVEDMFHDVYRVSNGAPEYLQDVGRSRSEALYKKMYGSSAAEVRKNLVTVKWAGGQNVQFTKVNGAADSLRAVAKEVSKYPELQPYLKSSGTFYWRPVRGAKRLSAHSYGIAFDIAVSKADYWQWNGKTTDEMAKVKYANKIPRKLVDIFQKHGFIWGGAWYHYDTMHFEFRPELIEYAKLKSK